MLFQKLGKADLTMAAGVNQKQKMLYLEMIFKETDKNNALTLEQIMKRLEAHEVNVTEKTLRDDLEQLRDFGYKIEMVKRGRQCYYYLKNNDFQLGELKLLIDAVQSSRFITVTQSRELIKKINGLASKYQKQRLSQQLSYQDRVKADSEGFFLVVDRLHQAISSKSQVRFQYKKWSPRKSLVDKHSGKWYQVSPLGLIWDAENYYLVAYNSDPDRNCICHYRVDKIDRLITMTLKNDKIEDYRNFKPSEYSKRLFGMFGGPEERVTVRVHNDLVGVFIDRFGKSVPIISDIGNPDYSNVIVTVYNSRPFLTWVLSLGPEAKIVSPPNVVSAMQNLLINAGVQYGVNMLDTNNA